MRKITAIDRLDGRRLRIHYGPEAVELDFAPLAQRAGVFAPLADQHYFEQVAIGAGSSLQTAAAQPSSATVQRRELAPV